MAADDFHRIRSLGKPLPRPGICLRHGAELLPGVLQGAAAAPGKALAVADGEGRNGVWLAEQGLDVLSIDFSPSAQQKARALAQQRRVTLTIAQVDVHTWDYPAAAFDVVVEIFTQFSYAGRARAGNGPECEGRSSLGAC